MLSKQRVQAFLVSVFILASARTAFAMGETGTLPFLSGENRALSAVIDSSHSFAYFGTDTSPFGQVVQVRLSDYVVVSTLAVTASNLTTAVIDSSRTFAYFGSSTTPAIISQVRLRDFKETAALTLLPGQNDLASVIIDSAANFAYFGTNTSPGIVIKINLSTLVETSSMTLVSGEDQLTCAVLDLSSNIGYFGTNTSPQGKIIKVNLSNMTEIKTLTLQSGENNLTSAVISTTTGFAYFGTNSTQGRVIRVRLSDFTEQPALFLNTGEGFLTSAVIDSSSTFAYFGTNTSPGQVIRVRLSDFTETFTTILNAGENSLLSAVDDSPRDFAYFGAGTSPGEVIRMDFLDSRTGPPILSAQPSDATVNPGETATFSVSAVGSVPVTYQWQLNGVAIPGATSSSYTTGALGFSDDGSLYSCVVTNSLGHVTTRGAKVTVIPVIKVFPNPWRSDQHTGFPMTFQGAAPNSTLKIFTLSMHWVKSVQGGGSTPLTWDLTNDAGQRVASGYYFYLITTPDAKQTVHGRFAIIK